MVEIQGRYSSVRQEKHPTKELFYDDEKCSRAVENVTFTMNMVLKHLKMFFIQPLG